MSDNALVVDVKEDTDTKEVPPCMLLKSDGASLYTTTDLATIVERMKLYNPDEIIYVVDKRQEMHFIQVFRCARKCGLVTDKTELNQRGDAQEDPGKSSYGGERSRGDREDRRSVCSQIRRFVQSGFQGLYF